MYTLKTTTTYRVANPTEALRLKTYLEANSIGELTDFSYKMKEQKSKGEVVDAWVLVSATFTIDSEKDPEGVLPVYIPVEKNDNEVNF